jgi:hypothetical protein
MIQRTLRRFGIRGLETRGNSWRGKTIQIQPPCRASQWPEIEHLGKPNGQPAKNTTKSKNKTLKNMSKAKKTRPDNKKE